jgi:hypothetical protein
MRPEVSICETQYEIITTLLLVPLQSGTCKAAMVLYLMSFDGYSSSHGLKVTSKRSYKKITTVNTVSTTYRGVLACKRSYKVFLKLSGKD